jgi:PAS domain S-box-containing protein
VTRKDETPGLREAAEARLKELSGKDPVRAENELLRFVHELQVHQIELEMQNTELRRTRAEHEAALERYTNLYDFAPVGYLTLDHEGQIVELNLTAATLLGEPRRNLLRKRFSRFVVRQDRERWIRFLIDVAARDTREAVKLSVQRADGSGFKGQLDCVRKKVGAADTAMGLADSSDEVSIVLTDISARWRSEEQAHFHSNLLKAVGQSVIATNAEGAVMYMNDAAERLYGWRADEAMGRSVLEVTVPDISQAQAAAIMAGLAKGESWAGEFLVTDRQGRKFDVEVHDTPVFDDKGRLICIIGISSDISERKRLSQAVADRNSELEGAKATAEKANRAKTDFLSSMSHELRTPLNSILGFAQLMETAMPRPTEAQQRDIERILKAGWYLLELVNEVLDLAQIESGKAMLTQQPVSVAAAMLECEVLIEQQAQKRGIGMSFPPRDIPWFVDADEVRLKQVLINLLHNAVKYNVPGGKVVVDCSMHSPDLIRISVSDTGMGLSKAHLAQLFQAFNRLGKECGTEEGTGIGLVVTKRLVELMGGSIGVESTVGTGSVFWFDLRRADAPQAPSAAGRPATAVTRFSPRSPRLATVLHVEDNAANLQLVEQLIARRPDLQLISAADGNGGIQLARDYLPQVILMDISLPGISGIEAMKALHADPATAHIPVIALTAKAIPHDVATGLEAGFFSYLTKPIRIDEFMDTLDQALACGDVPSGSTTDV